MRKVTDFAANKEIAKERLEICKRCKFFQEATNTCGSPLSGGTVKYNRKEYKLCGCIMPIKVLLSFSSCPVGKWSPVGTLPDFIPEIEEAVKAYEGSKSYESKKALFELEKRITAIEFGDAQAAKMQFSHCCWDTKAEDFRRLVKRYKKC